MTVHQSWSRGHKARGQGQGRKKNPRPRPSPRIAFPRTDTLEAKDRNARGQGQGHKRKCSPKKRPSQKFFRRSSKQKKKKVFTKVFQAISTKNVFQKIFQALHTILTIQKIVLSSSRVQANFRGLEASRPRTSKCVLEDSTSAVHIASSKSECHQPLKTIFFFSQNPKLEPPTSPDFRNFDILRIK